MGSGSGWAQQGRSEGRKAGRPGFYQPVDYLNGTIVPGMSAARAIYPASPRNSWLGRAKHVTVVGPSRWKAIVGEPTSIFVDLSAARPARPVGPPSTLRVEVLDIWKAPGALHVAHKLPEDGEQLRADQRLVWGGASCLVALHGSAQPGHIAVEAPLRLQPHAAVHLGDANKSELCPSERYSAGPWSTHTRTVIHAPLGRRRGSG